MIQLLVVIAVIAILAAMLLPALAKAKKLSQESFCKNNMKQLALAVGVYTVDNHDRLPLISELGKEWVIQYGPLPTSNPRFPGLAAGITIRYRIDDVDLIW